MGGFMAGADSSNQIYVSYQTLETILTQSEENATTTTDSTTGETTTTALRSMLNGTYAFDSVSDYENSRMKSKRWDFLTTTRFLPVTLLLTKRAWSHFSI